MKKGKKHYLSSYKPQDVDAYIDSLNRDYMDKLSLQEADLSRKTMEEKKLRDELMRLKDREDLVGRAILVATEQAAKIEKTAKDKFAEEEAHLNALKDDLIATVNSCRQRLDRASHDAVLMLREFADVISSIDAKINVIQKEVGPRPQAAPTASDILKQPVVTPVLPPRPLVEQIPPSPEPPSEQPKSPTSALDRLNLLASLGQPEEHKVQPIEPIKPITMPDSFIQISTQPAVSVPPVSAQPNEQVGKYSLFSHASEAYQPPVGEQQPKQEAVASHFWDDKIINNTSSNSLEQLAQQIASEIRPYAPNAPTQQPAPATAPPSFPSWNAIPQPPMPSTFPNAAEQKTEQPANMEWFDLNAVNSEVDLEEVCRELGLLPLGEEEDKGRLAK